MKRVGQDKLQKKTISQKRRSTYIVVKYGRMPEKKKEGKG